MGYWAKWPPCSLSLFAFGHPYGPNILPAWLHASSYWPIFTMQLLPLPLLARASPPPLPFSYSIARCYLCQGQASEARFTKVEGFHTVSDSRLSAPSRLMAANGQILWLIADQTCKFCHILYWACLRLDCIH